MKKHAFLFLSLLIALLLLSGCTPTAPLPSPIPPTITPTIAPDYKANSGIIEYSAAYALAYPGNQGMYTPEAVAARLITETIIGTDGLSYQFMLDPQTHVPLLTMSNLENGAQAWMPVHLKDIVRIPGGIEKIGSLNSMYPEFYKDVNAASVNTTWSVLEPSNNQYDFSLFDHDVAELKAKGLEIRGQNLIYLTQDWAVPEWVRSGNFSKAELEQIIIDHVTKVIQHGKALGVTEWCVVNEPYIQGERENDQFYKAFGGFDYIDIAFMAARKADPNAILIYNDYANHSTIRPEQRPSAIPSVELTRQIIGRLKNLTVVGDDQIARSVVDAVGVQSHLGGWVGIPPDLADVEQTLKSYGLPVIITEFDVNVELMTGAKEEVLLRQAQIYSDYLRAIVKSGAVTELTFWGLTDETAINSGKPNYDTAPALIDQYNKPKIAYYEVLKVLLEQVQNVPQ